MRSRVIDKSAAPAAGRWNFRPSTHGRRRAARRGEDRRALLTAGQVEALEKQVKEEARQRGFEEGLAAGKAEAAARIARLDALVARSRIRFSRSSSRVEDELVGLDRQARDHLVRRESSTIPPCCTPPSRTVSRVLADTCATSPCTSTPRTRRSCGAS